MSQRGPYDLFTGERNKPSTTGHYAVPVMSFTFQIIQYNIRLRLLSLKTEGNVVTVTRVLYVVEFHNKRPVQKNLRFVMDTSQYFTEYD